MDDRGRTTAHLANARSGYEVDSRLGATTQGEWREGNSTYTGQGNLYEVAELPVASLAMNRIPVYGLRKTRQNADRDLSTGCGFRSISPVVSHQIRGWCQGLSGIRRHEYVCDTTGKRDYSWKENQWAGTGWTLIRRVENEFIDVPERGFFPSGEPDELYTWPERRAQFIRRDSVFITAMSGEPASHTGKWSIFGRKGFEYLDLERGQRLPHKDEQSVKDPDPA